MTSGEFGAFYAASYTRLLKQLVIVTGDLAEAEDVLQEAFLRAAGRWHALAGYEAPEAWVRRVALNLAADSARRLRRRAAVLLRLRDHPVPEPPAELADLDVALERLSLAQRQVVVLHYLVGLPVAEVAAELRLPEGTVKTRLLAARRALARWLVDGQGEVFGSG